MQENRTLKRRNVANEDVEDWDVPVPHNLMELLSWKKISDDSDYVIVLFFESVYDITLKVMKNGINSVPSTGINVCDELCNLYSRIREFRITHKKQLSEYTLVGNYEVFCVDTLGFLCECNVINLIQYHFPQALNKWKLSDSDYSFLLKGGFLMVSPREKKVENYTQTDITLALYHLSDLWYRSELIPQLRRFIFCICQKLASYILSNYNEFADGIGMQFIQLHADIKTPSKEFFSDVSMITLVMSTGFFSLESFGNENTVTMRGKSVCEGYDIANVYASLVMDLKDKSKYGNQESYTKLVKNLVNYLYLRPGEEERFARTKFGLYTKDPSEVSELFRTQYQLFIHYNAINTLLANVADTTSTAEQPYKADAARGVLTHVKLGVVIKLFDNFCVSESNFNWIENCLILERDISIYYTKIHSATYPMVVQMGGEFNVFFKKNLYQCLSIEVAITIWLIIVCCRLDGVIWIYGTPYSLVKIKKKVDSWKTAKEIKKIGEEDDFYNAISDIMM